MGTFKLGFGIFVIAATIFLGVEVIPPYLSNYQFEDAIRNEATLNTYSMKPEEAIRDTILKRAQDLDIPVSKDQVMVKRSGPIGTGVLLIEVSYTVHVDLPVYPLDLRFSPSTRNRGVF